jgi:hypothetical protein
MKWELSLLPQKAATSLAVSQILSLNALTSPLHLCLSPGEALELVETRAKRLEGMAGWNFPAASSIN